MSTSPVHDLAAGGAAHRVCAAEQAQVVAREAVNRWTDNLDALYDYLKSTFGAEDQIKQLFVSVRCWTACMRRVWERIC